MTLNQLFHPIKPYKLFHDPVNCPHRILLLCIYTPNSLFTKPIILKPISNYERKTAVFYHSLFPRLHQPVISQSRSVSFSSLFDWTRSIRLHKIKAIHHQDHIWQIICHITFWDDFHAKLEPNANEFFVKSCDYECSVSFILSRMDIGPCPAPQEVSTGSA